MEICEENAGNQVGVLKLEGALTADTAAGAKRMLQEAVDAGWRQIVLDMSQVSFIDSTGLTALASGLKMVKAVDGSLKLAGLQHQGKQLFDLTMFDRIFETYETAEQALRSFEP